MQIKTFRLGHVFDQGGVAEFSALKNVTTRFGQGEFVTIIGRTGSGKTTFIEHLNALLRPSSGEVTIGDRVIKNGKRRIRKIKKLRKHVGIVFQFAEYQLFEDTIMKDVIFGPVNMGVKKDYAIENAKKYLEMVGISSDFYERSPFQLSGGQKRRVALAGILAMEPDFLIFDEPTAGLDPQGEIEIYDIFKKLHNEGKTIIVVTHNLDHALEHSNRTIIFKDGKILADGHSKEILYNKELLEKNDLEVPKLVSLVHDIEERGMKIGKVKNIKELAKRIMGE